MKKNYLIAVDLDDTLVYEFDKYDKVSFELLKRLSKTNYVVIATGRPYRSSKYYYDLLNLNTPIINYNGALVHHPFDKRFESSKITIDKNVVIKILEDNKDIIHNVFLPFYSPFSYSRYYRYDGRHLYTSDCPVWQL